MDKPHIFCVSFWPPVPILLRPLHKRTQIFFWKAGYSTLCSNLESALLESTFREAACLPCPAAAQASSFSTVFKHKQTPLSQLSGVSQRRCLCHPHTPCHTALSAPSPGSFTPVLQHFISFSLFSLKCLYGHMCRQACSLKREHNKTEKNGHYLETG